MIDEHSSITVTLHDHLRHSFRMGTAIAAATPGKASSQQNSMQPRATRPTMLLLVRCFEESQRHGISSPCCCCTSPIILAVVGCGCFVPTSHFCHCHGRIKLPHYLVQPPGAAAKNRCSISLKLPHLPPHAPPPLLEVTGICSWSERGVISNGNASTGTRGELRGSLLRPANTPGACIAQCKHMLHLIKAASFQMLSAPPRMPALHSPSTDHNPR